MLMHFDTNIKQILIKPAQLFLVFAVMVGRLKSRDSLEEWQAGEETDRPTETAAPRRRR